MRLRLPALALVSIPALVCAAEAAPAGRRYVAPGVAIEGEQLVLEGPRGEVRQDLGGWHLRNRPPGALVGLVRRTGAGTDLRVLDRSGTEVAVLSLPPGRDAVVTDTNVITMPEALHEAERPHDIAFVSLGGELLCEVREPTLRLVSGGPEADGRFVTVNLRPADGERTVIVYSRDGTVLWRYALRAPGVPTAVVTPNSRRLILVQRDAEVRQAELLVLAPGNRVRGRHRLPNVYTVIADDRRIASVGQHVVALLNARSGKLVWRRDEPIDFVVPGGLRLDARQRQLLVVAARRDRRSGTGELSLRRMRFRDGEETVSSLGARRMGELPGILDADVPSRGPGRIVVDDGQSLTIEEGHATTRDVVFPQEEYPGNVGASAVYDPDGRPQPSYRIRIDWDALPGAVRYELYRRTDGTGTTKFVEVDASQLLYFDDDVSLGPGHFYQYTVLGCLVDRCLKGGDFTTEIRVAWPISGGHELMHGFNEVLAWDGERGFHKGTDLNRTTPGEVPADDVRAPRGGIVDDIHVSPTNAVDDNAIGITVRTTAGVVHDTFNHISTAPGDTTVRVGDPVAPGQKVAVIGSRHFYGPVTDHVHMRTEVETGSTRVDGNPLRIFSEPADRDPQGSAPTLFDENQDGRTLLWRDHNAPSTILDYDHDTKPLSGDVDLLVEVTDQQGTNPRLAPIDVGYWIEGPLPPTEGIDEVRSAALPYRLYDFRSIFFGLFGPAAGQSNFCLEVADISDRTNAGCRHLTDCFTNPEVSCDDAVLKNPPNGGWRWPVLHHFIVTHATTSSGAPPDVDANQYWRTNAKQDGLSPEAPGANYAGRPTTTRAMDARFPDGDYTIHVIASDLVHKDVDLPIRDVRLENFPPFIQALEVYQDADGSAATQRGPDFPGCERPIYVYRYAGRGGPYPGIVDLFAAQQQGAFARAERTLCLKILFSESMAQVSVGLDPQGNQGAPPFVIAGTRSKTRFANDTWTGSIVVPLDPTGASDSTVGDGAKDAVIFVTAVDLPDRNGVQRNLDPDGSGQTGADTNHRIKLDASRPSVVLEARKES